MKNAKLFEAVTGIRDSYILEAKPQKHAFYRIPGAADRKKILCNLAASAAIFLILLFGIGLADPAWAKNIPVLEKIVGFLRNEMPENIIPATENTETENTETENNMQEESSQEQTDFMEHTQSAQPDISIELVTEKQIAYRDENFGLFTSYEPTQEEVTARLPEDMSPIYVVISDQKEQVIQKLQIPEISGLVLDMLDEKTGYLLYTSSGGAGMQECFLYYTTDRWSTYTKLDIGAQLDGYVTSFGMRTKTDGYIGIQQRNRAYLYRTTDGGETWEAVYPCQEGSMDGWAPAFDTDAQSGYLLVKNRGDDSSYQIYRTTDGGKTWDTKEAYRFRLRDDEDVDRCVVENGRICVVVKGEETD